MKSRNELINHLSSVIDDLYEFDTYSGYQSILRLLEEDIRMLIESCELNANESKVEKLVDFIHDNWHWCPFKDESGIDFEKECVGFRNDGCKECIQRNADKLNCQ